MIVLATIISAHCQVKGNTGKSRFVLAAPYQTYEEEKTRRKNEWKERKETKGNEEKEKEQKKKYKKQKKKKIFTTALAIKGISHRL